MTTEGKQETEAETRIDAMCEAANREFLLTHSTYYPSSVRKAFLDKLKEVLSQWAQEGRLPSNWHAVVTQSMLDRLSIEAHYRQAELRAMDICPACERPFDRSRLILVEYPFHDKCVTISMIGECGHECDLQFRRI